MTWYKQYNVVYDTLNEEWKKGFVRDRIINAFIGDGEFIDDKELRENDGQLQIYAIKGGNKRQYIINVSRRIPDISKVGIMHNKRDIEGLSEIIRIKAVFQTRTGFKLTGIV